MTMKVPKSEKNNSPSTKSPVIILKKYLNSLFSFLGVVGDIFKKFRIA